mgnify:CR=1 FL=1
MRLFSRGLLPAPPLHRFPAGALMPPAWHGSDPSLCYFFNPSIATHAGERIMAYRVVLPDKRRRMAVCRLDRGWQIVPESIVPLSDLVIDGGHWHGDPRFCSFGDRLLLHFNSGGAAPNDIFLVELDPATLRPLGPCRTVALDHPRSPVEKNWMFFAHDHSLYTVYSIAPHRVHRVRLEGTGPVRCESAYNTPWDSSAVTSRFGAPRGSTPPVRIGDRFHSFFHTRHRRPFHRRLLGAIRGLPLRGLAYGTGVYTFRAQPPFMPESCSPGPLFEPPLRRPSPRPPLAPWTDSNIYASGAVHDGDEWVVSAGMHDDGCALMRLRHVDVLGAMQAIEPAGSFR